MNRSTTTAAILLFCSTPFALAGCSQQTLEGARKDTEQNLKVVEREAKRVERNARPQLSKLDNGARVTAALRLNKKLPKTIRADGDTTGVRLKGTVATRAQKNLAGQIARDTLDEEKTVRNELVVARE
jgi:osmotically-inducible protein OsmY